jgi:hypothetical protein
VLPTTELDGEEEAVATRTPEVRARRHGVAAPPVPADARARLASAAPVAPAGRGRGLGDPRGLTVAGGAALVVLVALPVLAVDLLLGGGTGLLFGVAFVVGCALAALTVHREDLRAVALMPPLLHVGFALVAGLLAGAGPGGRLQGLAAQLAGALVYQAPVLWGATAASAGVAAWRYRGGGRR